MWCQASWACMNHFHTASWIKTDSVSPTPCLGHSPDFSAAAKVPSTSTLDLRDCVAEEKGEQGLGLMQS